MDKDISDELLGMVELVGFWLVLSVAAFTAPAEAIRAAESKLATDSTELLNSDTFEMEESDE